MKVFDHLWQILDEPIPYMKGMSLILLIKACLILLIIAVFSKLLIKFLKKKVFARYNIKEGTQKSISRLIHYLFIILGVFYHA